MYWPISDALNTSDFRCTFVFPIDFRDSATLFIATGGMTETTPTGYLVFPKRFQTLYKLQQI